MNILLVEDDGFKRDNISKFLSSYSDTSVVVAASVNKGLLELSNSKYGLVILDMSLPTFDVGPGESGGRPQGYGGREILRQLQRFCMRVPVIVVTQYAQFDDSNEIVSLEELTKQLHEEFDENLISVIYYSSSSDAWKVSLDSIIKELRGSS